ncbi:Peptidase M56, BlaR1 [Candidatus Sulfopaludibacter sp. SbA6]|nr:Peptidase M56, BlaR1 [Candidatus Sulfopaludibacter sp. SbA6]
MRFLEACIHTPLAKALGWSLMHFLWEGALVALALAVMLFLCGPAPARLRYALCCLAMLAMPVAFGLTLAVTLPGPHAAAVVAWPPRAPESTGDLQVAGSGSGPLAERLCEALPWVVPFWMAGVLVFYLRSLGGWMAVERLRRTGVCAAPGEWQERLHRLRDRLHLSTQVVLLESCLIDVPVAIGFLRPTILMPVGLLMGLSTEQVESILIHELAHIRRRDYLVNLLQKFVECVLFYHPAVWWVSGLVRAERENCCDDVVVKLNGDARGYAAALATLEKNRWSAGEPALAVTGGSLMKRIHRLIQQPTQQPERPRRAAAPVFAVGLLVVSLGVAVGGWQTRTLPDGRGSATSTAPVPAIPAERPQTRKPPATLVAQARPAQNPSTPAQAKPAEEEKLDTEPVTPYRKWMNEDVAYIITDAERAAFKNLQTDEEREHFIEQFWLRRDPTPGTPENEFKEEHYRRIAYANEHFASKIPGWKTDRGRIYITYGPPDEIESHRSGGAYQRPAAEGGGTTSTFPFEQWRYRYIEGIGANIIIEFVDPTMSGEYRMTMDPSEKDALRFVAPPSLPAAAVKAGATVQVLGNGAALLAVPLSGYGNHTVNVLFRITSTTGRPVANFEDSVPGPAPSYTRFVSLPAGAYRFAVTLKDVTTGVLAKDDLSFEVK